MASIDGDDLVVTVTERWIEGVKRYSRGTIDVVGTGTYTTGGVTLVGVSPAIPAVKRFGMDRQLDELRIIGAQTDSDPGSSSTTNFAWGYNPTLKTLVAYVSDDTDRDDEAGAVAVGPIRLLFVASGW